MPADFLPFLSFGEATLNSASKGHEQEALYENKQSKEPADEAII